MLLCSVICAYGPCIFIEAQVHRRETGQNQCPPAIETTTNIHSYIIGTDVMLA
jgi:hypothetical protein